MDNSKVELIFASFDQKLSVSEKQELEFWLTESTDNQRQFDDLKKIYEATRDLRIDFQPDEYKALELLNRKLKVRRVIVWSRRIAASLVSLFILTRIIMLALPDFNRVEVASTDQQVIYLPDSSKVTLAANSKLNYHNQFVGKERDVVLQGKAYFEIKPNKQLPFVIRTQNTKIKVLGTKFLVDASELNKEIVVVDEGHVAFCSVKSDRNNTLELTANEIGVWNSTNNSFTEQLNIDLNLNAEISKRMIFKEAPLNAVIRDFERCYQVKIELADKRLEMRKYSGSYSNLEVEKAIQILGNSLNLTISKNGNTYILQP